MVDSLHSELSSSFITNSEWYKPFFTDLSEPSSLKEQELKSFLEENLKKVSESVCKSIIKGEYVYSDVETHLNNTITCCNTIYGNIVLLENTKLHGFTGEFTRFITAICSSYIKFSKQITIHTSNPNTEIVFIASKGFSEEETSESNNYFDNDEVLQNCICALQLLALAHYDHFFDESIDYFKSLVDFENRLNSPTHPSIYYGIMHDKIAFLKYKWSIRQITTAKSLNTNNNYEKGYIIGDELIFIHQYPQFSSNNLQLKKWKEYLENHYEFTEHSNFYSNKINTIINENTISLFDFHFLIKYFKDIKPSYKNLKEYIENFSNREDEFRDSKPLFFKNLNYALNNQFSLLIETQDAKDEDVKKLKDKIDALQTKAGFDNFFVDFKLLKYNINKLENFINNREALEVKSEIIGKINEIRNLIISCEKKIKWSENHHNLLYQLPYDESLVDYNSEVIDKVYYASSFLLPLSVEQINNEFFDLKINFQNKYNHFEILSSLDKEFSVIKDLRDKAESSDKKSIETLTIFTAIISFIVGTVSGFSFIDSFVKALIFILIFSISLLTFVLLIFISTKGIEKILSYKGIISKTYFSVLGILVLLFCYKHFIDDDVEIAKASASKEIGNKKYIDSLNKYQDIKINRLENQFKRVTTTPQQQGGKTNSKTNGT
ncbi:hypothetical protein [Elizabethkingia anophelis]|uniref:Uncharacterized protein n=1 Tax=Elizabethkingia anophelis TaxID=1117645 RepID=A0AAE4T3Q8_9FLAO|nr:hypothetical protein [Elizabethkingia anophelis]